MDISQHTIQADRPRTFVLVDPTSDDGESSLDLLEPSDDHVSLVVLLSGRSSRALREYASTEGIDIASAGWMYLDQVMERVDGGGRIIETIVATGPDPALELADLVASNDTRRVVVPSSLPRVDPYSFRRLADGIPNVVISGGPAAAVR